jgi:hypothetical protein
VPSDRPITTYLPAPLADRINVEAASRGLSASAWLRSLLITQLRDRDDSGNRDAA